MPTRLRIERILRDLGTAQHGVAARAQLLERGLSEHVVDRLVRVRRISAVQRGVYQLGPLPVPRAAEHAALLAGPPGTRLSHVTAARLAGIIESDGTIALVEVTVPRGRRRRMEGVRVHYSRDLRRDESTVVDGLRITTTARTLLDIAGNCTPRVIEQAYATALRRRLVTARGMRTMLERHPNHRGTPFWRRLLGDGTPDFTRSKAEENLLELTRLAGLPRPQLNARVLGHEVDFLWRTTRVIVEVDGYAFHASARSFVQDRRRDAELTAAGYRVLRFTWSDLTTERLPTLARLAQALVRQG